MSNQVLYFPTYAALQAYTPSAGDTPSAITQGYYTGGDNGGAEYRWNSAAWAMVDNGVISAKQLGCYGDGATDDAALINAAISYCAANSKTLDLGDFFYRVNSQVSIAAPIHIVSGLAKFLKYGTGICILCQTSAGNGILNNDNNAFPKGMHPRVKFPAVVRMDNAASDLKDGSVGIQLMNCMNWYAEVPYIEGFETGLFLTANASLGSSYNNFYLGRLKNNVNVWVGPTTSTSYVNSNRFYNGSFNSLSPTVASDSTHILFKGIVNYFQCNENTFYSPALEGAHRIGIDFNQHCSLNRVINGRAEMPDRTFYYRFGTDTLENQIMQFYDFNEDMTTYYEDLGDYNQVRGSTQKYGLYFYYDKEWVFEKLNLIAQNPMGTGIPYLNRQILTETQPMIIPTFTSSTTFPVDIDMRFGNKFRIASEVDLPLNALRVINTPDNQHDFNLEILIVQSGPGGTSGAININPQFLTDASGSAVIRYGKWPAPYKRSSGKDRYIFRKSFQTVLTGWIVISYSSDNYNLNALSGIMANVTTTVYATSTTTSGITNTFLNTTFPQDAYPIGSLVILTTLTDAPTQTAECRRLTAAAWSVNLGANKL